MTKNKSAFSIEHWTDKGFSLEEAKLKIRERRPMYPEFWVRKGFSYEEGIEKGKEFQKNSLKNAKHPPESRPSRKEYWITRHGMTEEEAKQKVSESQKTFTIEKLIKKYGYDEGWRRYNERQQKWLATLTKKSQEEKDEINKKKAITFENLMRKYGNVTIVNEILDRWKLGHALSNSPVNKASRESLKVFIPLYKWCRKIYNTNKLLIENHVK